MFCFNEINPATFRPRFLRVAERFMGMQLKSLKMPPIPFEFRKEICHVLDTN